MRVLGLAAPADLAVIGFDDNGYGALTSPTLTTVHIDAEAHGRQAARAVLGLDPARHSPAPGRVVVRDPPDRPAMRVDGPVGPGRPRVGPGRRGRWRSRQVGRSGRWRRRQERPPVNDASDRAYWCRRHRRQEAVGSLA